MLAVLFADAGVLTEAREELDQLAQSNPGSARVAELCKSIAIPKSTVKARMKCNVSFTSYLIEREWADRADVKRSGPQVH